MTPHPPCLALRSARTAIAEELLAKRPYDLFLMYFEQVDSFSHLFMKYAPPKLPWIDEEGFARYRDVVTEWYRYQDELLGRVLAEIDLETTAVFVLSDHGFKSGERRIRSEELVDVKKAHLDHVSTHEDGERDKVVPQAEPIDASAQREVEAGLRSLGYLGDETGDERTARCSRASSSRSKPPSTARKRSPAFFLNSLRLPLAPSPGVCGATRRPGASAPGASRPDGEMTCNRILAR